MIVCDFCLFFGNYTLSSKRPSLFSVRFVNEIPELFFVFAITHEKVEGAKGSRGSFDVDMCVELSFFSVSTCERKERI